jgi:radical SAM protein with 4Fe4S-binding SPASM domain
MKHSSGYPRLRDSIQLRKYEKYVLVYDFHIACNDFLHPSEAVLLALCTGRYSVKQLEYLIGETYALPPEESHEFVEKKLQRFWIYLDFLPESDTNIPMKYDPKDFFYTVDESFNPDEFQKIPVPIGININLSFACNFRCRYCYQTATPGHGKLDLDTCLRLIREASEWGVAYAGLSGGEPTIFNGWMTLLEDIIRRGMNPVFTTNGVVIGRNPDITKELKRIGLKEITVSLDASSPDLHHYITRSHDTFSPVTNAISTLIDSGIPVSVKCVLTKYNMDDIGKLIDLVVRLGGKQIGVTICGFGSRGSGANQMIALSNDEIQVVCETVRVKQEQYRGMCSVHPPNYVKGLWDSHSWYPCGGLFAGMSIHPSGKVSICDKLGDDTPFIYGDVFKNSLREIWDSNDFRRLWDSTVDSTVIDEDCSRCSRLRECRTSCYIDSFEVHGKYFAKHPLCGGPF